MRIDFTGTASAVAAATIAVLATAATPAGAAARTHGATGAEAPRTAARPTAPTDRSTSRYCPATTVDGVRIVRLQRKAIGCRTAARLAARTVRADGGYLKTREYYCRWRSGASGRLRLDGRTYDEGFLSRPTDPSTASVVTYYARRVAR